MTTQPISPDFLLETLREAAAAGAAVIRDGARRRAGIVWREKAATDFVSEIDVGAEREIVAVLQRKVPGASYLAEESAATLDAAQRDRGVTFVIDPLDGTTNFLHGVLDYAVSIGAMIDGELAAGIVLDVERDHWYTATRGGGAYCNGERLSVSTIDQPGRALIATGFPFMTGSDVERYLGQMRTLMTHTAGIRRPGAASLDLAGVAAGRFEGFWENILAPWDIAAGILLVREAGGIVTDLQGTPCPVARTSVLAATPAMHPWLLERLK